MESLNEKYVNTIKKFDPKRMDTLCMIDVFYLSVTLKELKNKEFYKQKTHENNEGQGEKRTPDAKDVVDAFFSYATAVVEKHPNAHLDEYIEKMFNESWEKMTNIAPEAYAKYEAVKNMRQKSQTVQTMKHRDYVVSA